MLYSGFSKIIIYAQKIRFVRVGGTHSCQYEPHKLNDVRVELRCSASPRCFAPFSPKLLSVCKRYDSVMYMVHNRCNTYDTSLMMWGRNCAVALHSDIAVRWLPNYYLCEIICDYRFHESWIVKRGSHRLLAHVLCECSSVSVVLCFSASSTASAGGVKFGIFFPTTHLAL